MALNPRNREALVQALKDSASKIATVNTQISQQAALLRAAPAQGITEGNPPAPAPSQSQRQTQG